MTGSRRRSATSTARPRLQTVAAVAPAAKLRLVQTTAGGGALLDAYSRAIGDKAGPPDVTTLPYGGCAIAEAQASPQFLETINTCSR